MDYTETHGYKISKLSLGTVALGLDYNVFHKEGKPKSQECFEILSTALDAGINTNDTARGYGDDENLIGRYFESNREKNHTVITKFKISQANIFNKDHARAEAMKSVRASLDFLRLDRIPFYLFHMDPGLPIHQVLEILPNIFADLKHEGLIEHGGISAYYPGEVEFYLEHPILEAIQVPMNVFDQRLIKTTILKRMRKLNKIVFVRSIFLKGLFFMSPADLKGNLIKAREHIQLLQELANNANMSVSQLAFSYIRDLNGVTSIVFGAEKACQIKQNVELLNGKALSEELRNIINTSFENMPEEIITPQHWSF